MPFRNLFLFVIYLLSAHAVLGAGNWRSVSPDIAATYLSFDNKGTLYVIDTGHHLFYLERDSVAWKPLLKSKWLKSVSVSPDGTILALDLDKPYGYERLAGGKWESKAMNLKGFVFTNTGSRCMLTNDGRVLFDGKMLTGAFITISAMQKADGVYMLSIDKKPYRFVKGDFSPQLLPGNTMADVVTGTGYDGKGSQYVLNTLSGKLFRFDSGNAIVWQPVETPVTFSFISMSPAGDLYGIGTDHQVYIVGAGQ